MGVSVLKKNFTCPSIPKTIALYINLTGLFLESPGYAYLSCWLKLKPSMISSRIIKNKF